MNESIYDEDQNDNSQNLNQQFAQNHSHRENQQRGYDQQREYLSDHQNSFQHLYIGQQNIHPHSFSHANHHQQSYLSSSSYYQQSLQESSYMSRQEGANNYSSSRSESQDKSSSVQLRALDQSERKQKLSMEAKNQLKQKIIAESGNVLQNFQQALSKKIILYLKKGLTHNEAMNRALQKILYKNSHMQVQLLQNNSNQGVGSAGAYDPETYAKLRKNTGMSNDETLKTIQLKKEIDNLMNSKLHHEASNSSEESSSAEQQNTSQNYQSEAGHSSPQTLEKQKYEKKYKKKYKKVIERFIERVDNSSGSCSSDDKQNQVKRKKRKLQDFIEGQKYSLAKTENEVDSKSNDVKHPIFYSKRRHTQDQQFHQLTNSNHSKKRNIKEIHHQNASETSHVALQSNEEDQSVLHIEPQIQHHKLKRFKNE
eukprot:403364159